jgi:hypothetical protein
MIFLGFQLLKFEYIKLCNRDEIKIDVLIVICRGMTLELQPSSNFQGIPKVMVYIHKKEEALNYIYKIGKNINLFRTSNKLN